MNTSKLAVLAATCGIFALAGALAGWLLYDQGDDSGPEAAVAGIEVPADPEVTFLQGLDGLVGLGSQLIVHPRSGELWFPIFDSPEPKLYQYDPGTGELRVHSLAADGGSPLLSGIDVDDRGHIILAYGHSLVDFDPSSASFKTVTLPESANLLSNEAVDQGDPATGVAILNGKAYLSRFSVSAVLEVDLESGNMRELPLPATFGDPVFIASSGNSLYLSNWTTAESRQTGRLDPLSGEFEAIPLYSSGLVGGPEGSALVARADKPGLVRLDGLSNISEVDSQATVLGGLIDRLAYDQASGAAWLSGGAELIARVDLMSGITRVYQLPVFEEDFTNAGCPLSLQTRDVCEGSVGALVTHVGGIALDGAGNLYFTDQTKNRIGFIKVSP